MIPILFYYTILIRHKVTIDPNKKTVTYEDSADFGMHTHTQ